MPANRRYDLGFLGSFQVGQKVPLSLWTIDVAGVPREPDAAPRARIFNSSGTLVGIADLPIRDRYGVTGYFSGSALLGGGFAPGRYDVCYGYVANGYSGFARASFEVVPGGDAVGALISVYAVTQPEASYILAQGQSGRILRGRGPRIE